MKMAAKFNLPVVTMIDTPGAYPGADAEERGQSEAIATNLFECATLPVPILVIILGEGASGGAIAIGLGDRILMCENSFYSVISPEGCASILWRDSSKNKEAAEALRITAQDLMNLGIIDDIIPEPVGGAHMDFKLTAQNVKKAIIHTLDEIGSVPQEELINLRVEKFRKMGAVNE
jgi:acetyl-CoA carboxylase carboxyl transferase subunit alpha